MWNEPYAEWFVGGKLNVSYNCLDRHLEGKNAWRRNKAAIIWEGEPGDTRVLTYGELHREVEELQGRIGSVSSSAAAARVSLIHECVRSMQQNANKQVALDSLLFGLRNAR